MSQCYISSEGHLKESQGGEPYANMLCWGCHNINKLVKTLPKHNIATAWLKLLTIAADVACRRTHARWRQKLFVLPPSHMKAIR